MSSAQVLGPVSWLAAALDAHLSASSLQPKLAAAHPICATSAKLTSRAGPDGFRSQSAHASCRTLSAFRLESLVTLALWVQHRADGHALALWVQHRADGHASLHEQTDPQAACSHS